MHGSNIDGQIIILIVFSVLDFIEKLEIPLDGGRRRMKRHRAFSIFIDFFGQFLFQCHP